MFILTLTGPTCTGKTTLANALCNRFGFGELISTTTRPIRQGEVDGQHYHFVSRDEFIKKLHNGEMVEHVDVCGNLYGIHSDDLHRVFALNKPVVVVVEPNGVQQIQEYTKHHDIPLFCLHIDNPATVLAERFLKRFRDDQNADVSMYASRLVGMLTDEQSWSESVGFDHYLDFLDERNLEEACHYLRYVAERIKLHYEGKKAV